MYTHILWDFNGTLLDDVQIGIDSVNVLLARWSLPLLDDVGTYRRLFRFPIRDYYVALGLVTDSRPYEMLAPLWVEEYLRRVPEAGLQEGILPILAEVKKSGRGQYILSATEQKMLDGQVEGLGIGAYFDGVFGGGDIHAASKLGTARAFLKREKPGRMLLIGDTDHDAETAKEIGADCVLLACGHQTKEHLLSCGVPVVDTPGELLSFIMEE